MREMYYYDYDDGERKEKIIIGCVITGVVCALALPIALTITGSAMQKKYYDRLNSLNTKTSEAIIKFMEDNYDKEQIMKYGLDGYIVNPSEEDILVDKNEWAYIKKCYDYYLSQKADLESGKIDKVDYNLGNFYYDFASIITNETYIAATEDEGYLKEYQKCLKYSKVGQKMYDVCKVISIVEGSIVGVIGGGIGFIELFVHMASDPTPC